MCHADFYLKLAPVSRELEFILISSNKRRNGTYIFLIVEKRLRRNFDEVRMMNYAFQALSPLFGRWTSGSRAMCSHKWQNERKIAPNLSSHTC